MMAAVDLGELERIFAEPATYGEDGHSCARCGESYSLDDGTEESLLCHNCAHLFAESVMPALISELRALRASAAEGQREWIATSDRMPDSDVWVLAANSQPDYALVQLEFTDDSDGHGKPYWALAGGDVALDNYTHWSPLPSPPEKGST